MVPVAEAPVPAGGDYLEPDFEGLVHAMEQELETGAQRWQPQGLPTWDVVSERLLGVMTGGLPVKAADDRVGNLYAY
jgi:hypothetical protein